MEIRRPAYYTQFHCIASACPDSCCKAWAVQIDDESAARYRALPGELGDALRASLQEEDGDTILALTEDGRCPMWRQDGLCQIQSQLGADALCQVCRDFPRLRHDYGDFVELGLELSCPEAARLILSSTGNMISETIPGGDTPEYDREAMNILLQGRHKLLAILADDRFSPGQALAIMLLHSYRVQSVLDGDVYTPFDPDSALREAASLAQPGNIHDLLQFYAGLEILTERWKQRLAAPEGSDWSEPLRSIARYGIERYYLQAVSDYDLVGRMKMVIASCLVLKALGGDILDTAQLYSKEIENDADNIDAILDGAYTSPSLADVKLLGLLLTE